MQTSDSDLQLVDAASKGDTAALDQLLLRHRPRLRQAVSLRLSPQVAARVDPSDIVQETFVEAVRRFSDYSATRPVEFYPWLRRIAADQLARAHRTHLGQQRRSVQREQGAVDDLSESSWDLLAQRLPKSQANTPVTRMLRSEARRRVQQALEQLSVRDREVIVLRFLEDLSVHEVSQVLDATEPAIRMRQLRALQRLQVLLERGEKEA